MKLKIFLLISISLMLISNVEAITIEELESRPSLDYYNIVYEEDLSSLNLPNKVWKYYKDGNKIRIDSLVAEFYIYEDKYFACGVDMCFDDTSISCSNTGEYSCQYIGKIN